MATIGYSYWGFLNPDEMGPDGAKYTRWQLFNRLIERGHKIICLQRQRDKVPGTRKPLFTPENMDMFKNQPHFQRICENVTWEPEGFPEVDFAIFEHRWKQFPGQEDPARQDACLEYYGNVGIPCLLWDQDHKISKKYEVQFPNAILIEPSEKPKLYTRERYTWHYAADAPNIGVKDQFSQLLAYVGNNYDRDKQFDKYVGSVAYHFPQKVHVYGNWLRKPKNNKYVLDPETPVTFHKSVPQSAIQGIYSDAGATVLITKPSYAKTGLMSIRLLEATHAGTIVLGPSEITGIENFVLPENIVSSTEDVVNRLSKINKMNIAERQSVVHRQLKHTSYLNTETAVDVLNKILKDATQENFAL